MLKKRLLGLSLIAIVLFGSSLSFARHADDDWSQFRGPNGTGISNAGDLPTEFGPNKNVIWKAVVPPGHSSPVLGNRNVYMTAFEGEKLITVAVEKKTGKELWRKEIVRKKANHMLKPNNPASPSPVTDGDNVYAFFADFGLVSYSGTGKERWRVALGPFNSVFGLAASPILVDDKVILPCDQNENSFLLAVDKNTGKIRWRTERPEVISGYSTPIVYRPKTGPAQIVLPEAFKLSAYSVETGQRVWWVNGLACEMKSIPAFDGTMVYINGWGMPENQPGKQIAIPTFEDTLAKYDKNKDGKIELSEAPDERIKQKDYFDLFDLNQDGFLDRHEWDNYRAMMAAENGLLAIHVGGNGDVTANSILWKYQKPVPQVPSTLLYKGVLYMVNDGGRLISFDPKTGNVLKEGRLQGAVDKYFASPVGADDKVFLVGQGGAVSVLKAAGEWQILAVNNLDDECFATPAIASGRIYIRTRSALYCFGKRGSYENGNGRGK